MEKSKSPWNNLQKCFHSPKEKWRSAENMTFSFPFFINAWMWSLSFTMAADAIKFFDLVPWDKRGSWKIQEQKKSDHALNVRHKTRRRNFFWAYLNLFKTYPNKKVGPKMYIHFMPFLLCIQPFFFHVPPSTQSKKGYEKKHSNITLTPLDNRLKQFFRFSGRKNLEKILKYFSWLHCPFSSLNLVKMFLLISLGESCINIRKF